MSGVRLVTHLSYGPTREQTVVDAPGGRVCYSEKTHTIEKKPMIRLASKFLLDAGFSVGSKVDVQYGEGVITITKKSNSQSHENRIQVPSPLPISGAASAVAA